MRNPRSADPKANLVPLVPKGSREIRVTPGSQVAKAPRATPAIPATWESKASLESRDPQAHKAQAEKPVSADSRVPAVIRVQRVPKAQQDRPVRRAPRGEGQRAVQVLRIQYWQAPTLPGPYLSAGTKDRDAGAITLEPLAKYDPLGNIIPALAREIPTVQNGSVSEDFTSITWTLKDGIKWSDGNSMTAADVVFTWRYCAHEATGCTAASAFAGISDVRALDHRTVRITFDGPKPYPYTAFVSTGQPQSSARRNSRIASARPLPPAMRKTSLLWAPVHIALPHSKPMRTPPTSATPSTMARPLTSTG